MPLPHIAGSVVSPLSLSGATEDADDVSFGSNVTAVELAPVDDVLLASLGSS
jgi:hypothetical protein